MNNFRRKTTYTCGAKIVRKQWWLLTNHCYDEVARGGNPILYIGFFIYLTLLNLWFQWFLLP
jgi:hypothetical protein